MLNAFQKNIPPHFNLLSSTEQYNPKADNMSSEYLKQGKYEACGIFCFLYGRYILKLHLYQISVSVFTTSRRRRSSVTFTICVYVPEPTVRPVSLNCILARTSRCWLQWTDSLTRSFTMTTNSPRLLQSTSIY